MTELQASRTLVKSPPELWAECSDAASLARHLDRFGEIRITRLDPETAVAWEGERASGTVRIEPAGWGTKVILTAVAEVPEAPVDGADAPAEPEPPIEAAAVEPDPPIEPEAHTEPPVDEPAPPPRKRRFARLRAYWRGEPVDTTEAAIAAETEAPEPLIETPTPEPETPVLEAETPVLESETTAPEAEAQPPVISETEAALAAALDSLGQAHHRPYSRA